jgi:hypothetical protein
VTNPVLVPTIWLIVVPVLCIVVGYAIGRSSGKEHILRKLTREYRRELEQNLRRRGSATRKVVRGTRRTSGKGSAGPARVTRR